VDPWFLVHDHPDHTKLLEQARLINDRQAVRLVDRLISVAAVSPGDKVAVLGAAYKPDIEDAREKSAAKVSRRLQSAGLRASVHDPLVREGTHDGMWLMRSLEDCLSGAKAAVILTEHRAY